MSGSMPTLLAQRLALTSIVLAASMGCVSTLAPTAPQAATPLHEITQELDIGEFESSYVALVVPVDFNQLNTLINENVPRDFATLNNIQFGNGLSASVTLGRNADVQLLALEGRLQVIVPLRLDIAATWSTRIFGRTVGHTENITVAAAVRIDTQLNTDNEWNATSESNVDFTIGTANVGIGPARVNLRELLDAQLRPYVGQISELVDQTIGESLNLRGRMEQLWPRLLRPIQLSEDPSLWIRLEPQEVQWVRPQLTGSAFTFGIGVRTRVRSYLGNPPSVPVIPPLPALTEVPTLANEFHLYVPIQLPFEELTRVARARLVGTDRLLESGATIHIESIDIRGGTDGRIHIALGITARKGILHSAHGTLHMLGTPTYDPTTRIVSCENVEYALDTRNVLLRTASYAMHDDFLAGVQDALTFEAGESIDSAIASANAGAAEIEISEMLTLAVSVDRVDIGSILISDTAMVIIGEAHGTVDADVSLFRGRIDVTLESEGSSGGERTPIVPDSDAGSGSAGPGATPTP